MNEKDVLMVQSIIGELFKDITPCVEEKDYTSLGLIYAKTILKYEKKYFR